MDKRVRATEDITRTDSKSLEIFLPKLRDLILEARRKAATAINSFQVATNYEIGRLIVEQEQQGSERAAYGASLIKELSIQLSGEFRKGLSPVNLSLMRKFYLVYRDRMGAAKFQTPSETFMNLKRHAEPSGIRTSHSPEGRSSRLIPLGRKIIGSR
jgi:hypothetical protein